MPDLDNYVRGASCLYEAVKDRYIRLTGEAVEQPHIPLLLDKPPQDLPTSFSEKMEEYQAKLIAKMEAHPMGAKAYLNTALFLVFHTTFLKTKHEELYNTYCDAAEPVWENMYRDDSIDALLTWIADTMPVPE